MKILSENRNFANWSVLCGHFTNFQKIISPGGGKKVVKVPKDPSIIILHLSLSKTLRRSSVSVCSVICPCVKPSEWVSEQTRCPLESGFLLTHTHTHTLALQTTKTHTRAHDDEEICVTAVAAAAAAAAVCDNAPAGGTAGQRDCDILCL